jgi:SAM-dependent methyltransferase
MASSYYDVNAQSFCDATERLDVSHLRQPFLAQLPEGGHILDLGCGSGRDTRAFLAAGYQVTAMDPSPGMAQEASCRVGIPVAVARAEQLEERDRYDGVWACASLLHVDEQRLDDVLRRIATALRPRGVLYVSFKYGSGPRIARDGRYFHDLTDTQLERRLASVPVFEPLQLWLTNDVRMDRPHERWVNGLVRRR